MTTTGNSKPAQAAIDWRRVVSTACLECDWSAIATTALGSRELAAMVGEALRMIGRSIENGIAQTEAQAPPVPVDEPSVEREDSPEVEMSTKRPPRPQTNVPCTQPACSASASTPASMRSAQLFVRASRRRGFTRIMAVTASRRRCSSPPRISWLSEHARCSREPIRRTGRRRVGRRR